MAAAVERSKKTVMREGELSPKAIAALVWPAVIALGAAVSSWVITGDFNDTEIRTAVGGVIGSLISFAGAYLSEPGEVEVVDA